jgi:glycosyltransferase involved in cell wall biosynthesis
MDSVSIIIPCLNEERYIESCIDSILSANLEGYAKEIIFVDGGSLDRTVEIIEEYQKNYSFIKLLHNPKKFTPISMNMGIKASSGDYIFIISAHAEYESSYFSKLVKYIKELNANCVGGVLQTEVKSSNKKSNSIKEILAHRLGVGNADFRTGSSDIKEVDTVAFGCYTKATFEKYGLYDERLIRNQDIELNKRIVNGGGKIYLIPKVESTYYARENFMELAKNNHANGKWNILTAYHTKMLNSLSLRHFIPLIFLLSLLLPLPLSAFYFKLLYVALFSLSSYLALVIITSFQLRDKSNGLFYLVGSFLTLHLSYGFGSLMGIFSVINKIYKGKQWVKKV